MKIKHFSQLLHQVMMASTFAVLSMSSLSSNADWTSNAPPIQAGVPQDIVITLKLNPMSQPEAACLSVTLARSLSGDLSANVTLFPTLDGVALGDSAVVSSRRFKCNTPWGEISLQENLEAFINGNPNNMVICPLCWTERYGEQLPDYGVLDSSAVGALLLNAEKVIDF
jgi:hypothetical protein